MDETPGAVPFPRRLVLPQERSPAGLPDEETPDEETPDEETPDAPAPPDSGIVVNGSRRPLPRPASVRGALEALGLAGRPVAVELNGRLVRRADHPRTAVRTGDRVEIVTFVGGG